MAQENWQKIKMIKLVELLRQETDELHPLTTSEICVRMEEMDIPCDRRVLSKDIALLNSIGVEVRCKTIGTAKAYYTVNKDFSVPELKILIDAVQAANFITEEKTKELVDKIANLGGTHQTDILKDNIVCFNTRKHSNEGIYTNVASLVDAIQRKRKVIFRYFDLNIAGQKAYRRDGHHYVIEPVALVFNEDNYYLIAYSAKHDNTANYRVDRMDDIELIDEKVSEKAVALRDEVGKYTEQAIKMYNGALQSVVLEFDSNLIGAVYDRFGEGLDMIESGDNKVVTTVWVQLSPTFFGWLFQFGRQMRVLSPDSVIERYKALATEILE